MRTDLKHPVLPYQQRPPRRGGASARLLIAGFAVLSLPALIALYAWVWVHTSMR